MKIDKRRLKKGLRMALTFVPTVGPALEILVEDIRASQTELDQQVTQAIESLQQTSALISRLEQALGERTEKVNRLREEYERYSKLSEIGADKAEALIRQLSLTVGQNQKRERWVAFGINLAAGSILFVAGVVLSDPMKALVGMILH